MYFDFRLRWSFFTVRKLVSRLGWSQSWLCPFNTFSHETSLLLAKLARDRTGKISGLGSFVRAVMISLWAQIRNDRLSRFYSKSAANMMLTWTSVLIALFCFSRWSEIWTVFPAVLRYRIGALPMTRFLSSSTCDGTTCPLLPISVTSVNWRKNKKYIIEIHLIWGEPSSCARWHLFAADFLRVQVVKTEVFLAYRNRTYSKRPDSVSSRTPVILSCNAENNINSTSHQHTSDYCILWSRYLVPDLYSPFLRHLVADWYKFALDFAFHLHMALNMCRMVPMQNNHH